MYQTKADTDRNRLYITLEGRLTTNESRKAARQVISDMNTLTKGFDVVTDISEFEPVTQKETEILMEVQKALLKGGVNRIVRVIGSELKATVGKIQFERTSRQSNISAKNFNTVEEADRFLDG